MRSTATALVDGERCLRRARVHGQTVAAGVDHGAADQRPVRLRRTAVVDEGTEHRVAADHAELKGRRSVVELPQVRVAAVLSVKIPRHD